MAADWDARDAARKAALARAREYHAQSVHMIEKGQPHHSIAYSLAALLTIALSHERDD